MPPLIRPAAIDDVRGIAEVHVATWRAAYAGIVSQAHLDALSVDARTERWRKILGETHAPGWALFVSEEDGRITGFASASQVRGDEAASAPGLGEITAIYVDRSRWDTGTGRALHDAAIGALRAAGFRRAMLHVLVANARARRFYERAGWHDTGRRSVARLGDADIADARYERDL